jgi:colanic acid/amylovoran biosynthesis glycosyltransferase
MQTIGYLVPEFPGQTHNFFWREIAALNELGVGVQLFSTRLPLSSIESTSWGKDAKKRTLYLFPLGWLGIIQAACTLFLAGPQRIWRCFRIILGTPDLSPRARGRMLGLLFLGAHLSKLARAKNIQHIHVHSCADAANIALFAHLVSSITYSLTLHNPVSIFGSNQKEKWHNASFAIVIAHWVLNDLQKQLGNALPDKISIAPMGVNTDIFRRDRPYEHYQKTQPLRLFSCARLNPCKGFIYLLAAVDQLRQDGYQVNLRIAGEDDKGGKGYRQELEAKIKSLQLEQEVQLLGPVSEEVVREELQIAHVFVLASLEEPLGVALMEAMAMEVPVVATKAGGVPELIVDRLHGLLVPPCDNLAIAKAVSEIANNTGVTETIRLNGRARIESEFGHKVSASKISEHLKEIF